YAQYVAERPERRRCRGNRPSDSGPARTAGERSRYRRSNFRRNAHASADAAAQRTTVSWVAVRAREIGRLLPVITDLAARRVPWFLLVMKVKLKRHYAAVVEVASTASWTDGTDENSGISPSTNVGCVKTASRSAV